MNNSFLLQMEDMINETHSPVIGFFSVISGKSDFVRIIDRLSNGIGHGYQFAVCLFPDDVTMDSEKFGEGVEFSIHGGKSVVISYEEFYHYLQKACMNYVKKYPSEMNTISRILEKAKNDIVLLSR